jgi:hypothetical protein
MRYNGAAMLFGKKEPPARSQLLRVAPGLGAGWPWLRAAVVGR